MNGHYKTQRNFEKALERLSERCKGCRHLLCLPHMRWLICHKRKCVFCGDGCPSYESEAEHCRRNAGNEPKPVAWDEEYEYCTDRKIIVPHCPACGEYADPNDESCRFCGQPIVPTDDPRPEDIEVRITDGEGHVHTLVQVGQYNSLNYSVDGVHCLHTSPSEKARTKEELLTLLREWIDRDFPNCLFKKYGSD